MEQEKIKCACGSIIQKNSLPAHNKSKKHNKFLKNPDNVRHSGERIVVFN
jgi:hypothetical protein